MSAFLQNNLNGKIADFFFATKEARAAYSVDRAGFAAISHGLLKNEHRLPERTTEMEGPLQEL